MLITIEVNKMARTDLEIKNIVEKQGFKLLEIIRDNRLRVKLQCSQSHIRIMRFDVIQKGSKCRECTPGYPVHIHAESTRLTLDYVKSVFEKEGYTLLSDTYKNIQIKLDVICPNGHNWQTTYSNFVHYNKRCKTCWEENRPRYDKEKERKRQAKWARKNYQRKLNAAKPLKIMDDAFFNAIADTSVNRYGSYLNAQAIKARFELFNFSCAYCGYKYNLQIDHIIPRSKNGKNQVSNIVPCCDDCNRSKKARDVETWFREQEFFTETKLLFLKSSFVTSRI